MSEPLALVAFLVGSYAIGSIPWAYIIVRSVTGADVTQLGTGNVGAMNVRRATGSWGWFATAMLADAMKGLLPVAAAKVLGQESVSALLTPAGELLSRAGAGGAATLAMAAVCGAVLGHNYSCWMALLKRRFHRTGKGLATGGGALLAYDWRYFLAVVAVGLAVIAITRYMMAGQVAAALTLPVTAALLASPDWPFALAMGLVVYAAHHRRFIGLLRGQEPKLYINDAMGPRG